MVGVGFVTIIQLVDDGTTKHSFALSVNEHDLLAFMVLVLGQRTVDDVDDDEEIKRAGYIYTIRTKICWGSRRQRDEARPKLEVLTLWRKKP